jgi:hypothetical protein
VIEGPVELVDRVRAKGVAHLRPVERDPHRPLVHRPVVGDVGEAEPFDFLPRVPSTFPPPSLLEKAAEAAARFGKSATAKLRADGHQEDQLRAPLERLFGPAGPTPGESQAAETVAGRPGLGAFLPHFSSTKPPPSSTAPATPRSELLCTSMYWRPAPQCSPSPTGWPQPEKPTASWSWPAATSSSKAHPEDYSPPAAGSQA